LDTRTRIVKAARRVMEAKGLARSTTREIAETIPCSEGTLYRYFTSKDELFLAVLTEELPGFIPVLRDLSTDLGERDLRETLRDVAASALAFYAQAIPMFASIFAEPTLLLQLGERMRANGTGPHRAVASLAEHLSLQQRAGRLNADADPQGAAALLLGACYQRAFFLHSVPGIPTSDDEFLDTVVDTLLVGLLPHASQPGRTRPDS
jgi:AcrR family transcriptional regulator